MTDPSHAIAISMSKPVNAWFLAMFAKDEWQKAINNVRQERWRPYPDAEPGYRAFWLADAADWRRVYQTCMAAVDAMGGL